MNEGSPNPERPADGTYMVEAAYLPPDDPKQEAEFLAVATAHGGWLDFRETNNRSRAVVLTFEFPTFEQAEEAADLLEQAGARIVGFGPYG